MGKSTKLFSFVAIGKLILSVALLLITAGCSGGGSSGASSSGANGSGGSNSAGGNGTPPPPPPACTVLASNLSLDIALNGAIGRSAGFDILNPVLDNSNVYWFEFDSTQGSTGGSIRTISKNGGQVTVLASGLGGVNDLAMDNTNVYWTAFDILSGNGAIKSVPKTGGAVTVLASGTPPGSMFDVFFSGGLTFDSTYVYWGEQVGGGAIRIPVLTVWYVAVDDANVYGLGPSVMANCTPTGGCSGKGGLLVTFPK